ncbi:MAG: hypothetical protein LBQ16_00280 [Gracilibacteraceae bacterium]|jgi:uncharacterized protein YceH (UPF0502 family)|nr:hypothetical protein [Gracilibacteraceae bacterium]
MASLSSLRRDLNQQNAQVSELNDKIQRLKKRRSDVEDIRRELSNTAGSNAGEVNNKVRAAGSNLDKAIKHSGQDSRLQSLFSGKIESAVGADSHLTSADSELQMELADVNRKINEAESNLAAAQRRVSALKSAIAAEERREREERKNK